MIPVEGLHDGGSKTLLGQTIPAGQTAEADLAAAFNIVFNHPNVGPFVATQLIEHLVTSNPSPAYVQRVATAFNTGSFDSYGSGKRGDMQATIAAILLDPEARRGDNPMTVVPTDGKLREPAVVIASIARAFHAQTDAGSLAGFGGSMEQNVFNAGSVSISSPLQSHCGNHIERTGVRDFRHELSPSPHEFRQQRSVWLAGLEHHVRLQRADQRRLLRPDGGVARHALPAEQHAGPDETNHPYRAGSARS